MRAEYWAMTLAQRPSCVLDSSPVLDSLLETLGAVGKSYHENQA